MATISRSFGNVSRRFSTTRPTILRQPRSLPKLHQRGYASGHGASGAGGDAYWAIGSAAVFGPALLYLLSGDKSHHVDHKKDAKKPAKKEEPEPESEPQTEPESEPETSESDDSKEPSPKASEEDDASEAKDNGKDDDKSSSDEKKDDSKDDDSKDETKDDDKKEKAPDPKSSSQKADGDKLGDKKGDDKPIHAKQKDVKVTDEDAKQQTASKKAGNKTVDPKEKKQEKE